MPTRSSVLDTVEQTLDSSSTNTTRAGSMLSTSTRRQSVSLNRQRDEEGRPLAESTLDADMSAHSGNNAVNPHAIIALAVFLKAGVRVEPSTEQLRLFVLKSLVCDLYRRRERLLSLICDFADSYVQHGSDFDLRHFESEFELPSGQKMEVSVETLENLLMLPIGDPRTYLLLSLLHPQHALHQHAFDKDHIHPSSAFADLGPFKLGPEREAKWYDLKDKLPNLQLLQAGVNRDEKRAKLFKDWLPVYRPREEEQKAYLAENDIPAGVSLELADFEVFFHERKERLRQRLMSLLRVTAPLLPIASTRSDAVQALNLGRENYEVTI